MSDMASIFGNQALVVSFLWLCGILIAVVGWYEVFKGRIDFGIAFLAGSFLVLAGAVNIELVRVSSIENHPRQIMPALRPNLVDTPSTP